MSSFGLCIITGLAVYFGARAATTAANALRLEAEPVLVVTDPRIPPYRKIESLPYVPQPFVVDPTHWYIVGIDVDERIYLRRDAKGELDTRSLEPPGSYLEIKNVGRSAAVGITLPLHVYTGAKRTLETLAAQGPNDFITIDGIAPNSSYFIGIANHLGENVSIQPDIKATQIIWSKLGLTIDQKVKKKSLPVLSMTFVFPPHRR